MSVLGTIIRPMAECGIDSNGDCVTHSPILPETPEIIWGGLASLIIFAALYKFAGPADRRRRWPPAPRRSRASSTPPPRRRPAAQTEAGTIRQAAGDIEAERARLLADADAQAEALLAEGRARLEQEVADLDARADAEHRVGRQPCDDELRAEISRLANEATDRVLARRRDRRRHAAGPHRGLHPEGGCSQHERRTYRRLRPGAVRDRPRRGHARRGRGRAVPASPAAYESSDCAAQRADRRVVPAGKRQAIVEDLLGGKATSHHHAAGLDGGRLRPRPDLPAIIDNLVARASSAKNLEVAEVRSAVAAHRRPAGPARRRPRERDRQAGQPEDDRRPVDPRRHRAPPSATPSSTAASAPVSTNSSRRL